MASPQPLKSNVFNWLILIILAIIWGSSYWLIKHALEYFDWKQVAMLRVLLAFLAFIPFLPKAFNLFSKKILFPVLIVGFCGTGFPAFLFSYAQTHIDSGITGILSSTTPLFTLVIAILLFGQKIKSQRIIGILVGLAGALALIFSDPSIRSTSNYIFAGLVLVATMGYALSGNTVKAYLQNESPVHFTAMAFLFLAIPLIIFGFVDGQFLSIANTQNWHIGISYLVVLAFFGTFLSNIIYFKLIQRTDAVFGSTVSYLIPCVAVLLALWDGEQIGWIAIGCMGIILIGVNLSRKTVLQDGEASIS